MCGHCLIGKSSIESIMLHGKLIKSYLKTMKSSAVYSIDIIFLYLGLAYDDPPNRAEVTLAGKIIFCFLIVVVFDTCEEYN